MLGQLIKIINQSRTNYNKIIDILIPIFTFINVGLAEPVLDDIVNFMFVLKSNTIKLFKTKLQFT